MEESGNQPVYFGMGDARRIDRAVSAFEHEIIGGPTPPKKRGIPGPPILMLALQDFSTDPFEQSPCEDPADNGVMAGRAARVRLNPNIIKGPQVQPTRYLRYDGLVECVWQPIAEAPSCVLAGIKCGNYFWATENDGRLEVLAGEPVENITCPCIEYGFAIWKVVDDGEGNPIWELDENRCSGCYSVASGVVDRAGLDLVKDIRFNPVDINEDWLSEPGMDPPETWMDGPERYVTCCNDVDEPVGCELQCCYGVTVNRPDCDGGTEGTKTLILDGGGIGCRWYSGEAVLAGVFVCAEHNSGIRVVVSAAMSDEMGLRITVRVPTVGCPYPFAGGYFYHARYTLSAPIDCVSTLTATYVDTLEIGCSPTWACDTCPDFDPTQAFPATISVAPIACDAGDTIEGRCCHGNAECDITNESDCDTLEGEWLEGADCSGTPCGTPVGRCCYPIGEDAFCTVNTEDACALLVGSTWLEGEDCDGAPCGQACVPHGCIWEWQGGDWSPIVNTCHVGCEDCGPAPLDPGTEVGERAFADCVDGA